MGLLRNMFVALPLVALACACSAQEGEQDTGGEGIAEATGLSASPFAPRDECSQISGVAEFLAQLDGAVAARDADALLTITAEDVRLDFGGGGGHAILRQRLTDPDYDLWQELGELAHLGCAEREGTLTLPWYFAQDIGERDPYGAYVVIGEDVPLFAAEDGDEVQLLLDWQMVDLVAYYETSTDFGSRSEIRLDDGTRGFVEEDQIRGLIDYRLVAEQRDGAWKVSVFVAGD